MSYLRTVREYCDAVRNGTIPSCGTIRLAVARWDADWQRDDIYFDEDAFNRFVNFSSYFKHYKGPMAGRYFRMEPWQMFIAANVFGWYRRDRRVRRYNYADVYLPRKNGKTYFATIIALYCLMADGEAAAEVYAAAVDKEQAKICFEAGKELLERSDYRQLVRIYRGEVKFPDNASSFKPLSKDTKNKDGLNPSCGICDERHAWKTNEIFDVLKTGMGARSQPLLFSISTAGTDTSNPYFADLEFMRDILKGKVSEDNHFVAMWEPDEGDDWSDEGTWAKVNPNYGVSLSKDYMQSEFATAKQKGGSTLAAFQTKNLNMWVDAPDTWIADDDVVANVHDVPPLEGSECYVGIDLASKTDVTAVAFWFPRQRAVRWLYIVPEAKLTDPSKGDRVDYRKWYEAGWLVVAPGKVLDEDWFVNRLICELRLYDVKAIAFDPWGMWNILNKFGVYQDVLQEYRQSIGNMSVPTKWVESEVLRHSLDFGGNPLTRWMFGNVVIYRDPNDNIKLDKARSRNKIDGVVALVDAVGIWLVKTSGKSTEIYADHGLRYIPSL